MNSVTDEAVKLCNLLLDNMNPLKDWCIFNICKGSASLKEKCVAFDISKNYPSIPTSFYYYYDQTPQFLVDLKVIESFSKNLWCTGTIVNTKNYTFDYDRHFPFVDSITQVAREKKYITEEEMIHYYSIRPANYHPDRDGIELKDLGPREYAGLFSILVTKNGLRQCINKYKSTIPQFDKTTGVLSFLGEELQFTASLQIKTIELLIQNVNSTVSYKELHNIRDATKYEKAIINGKSKTHDAIDSTIKDIKKNLKSNQLLDQTLIIIQKDGHGLFINQKSLK